MLFHQDNAAAHKSLVTLAAIHECDFQLVQHPPYSPDLAPSDYYLFPSMKNELYGRHFATKNDVIDAVDHFLEDQDSINCSRKYKAVRSFKFRM